MATPDFRPFPAHKVIYHPSMITAQGAVYRSVLCLTTAYWLAACRDIPTDNSSLAMLIHIPNGAVAPIRSALLATFGEIAPILKDEWEAVCNRDRMRHERAAMGTPARIARAIARGGAKVGKLSETVIPPSPNRAEPLENELRRQIARNAAMNVSTAPRLSDGSAAERLGAAQAAE